MVGERGFEPPTPWSRIQRPEQEGMSRSERKLHPRNKLPHFPSSATRINEPPFATTCTGLDTRVTSQLTSQFFPPGLLASRSTGGRITRDGTHADVKFGNLEFHPGGC